ncbi:endo-1,4-beta-glucanase [Klebsormidium nitens]|uniref:cellulase n=1 Tax=Klebsormidium nitens TaxID=105231 RepID=A0A1Y1HPC9_KLENI|nr:endo-1,4-beta-glucanase [Klebsormidium nitens]|eukprot:GAQ78831.1 endo-1,4-beta-glucanase [Klebsormidium nitens]
MMAPPRNAGDSRAALVSVVVALAALLSLPAAVRAFGASDYQDALAKCTLFYEAQRSGALPSSNRVSWRGDSGLLDGQLAGVDLTGGYYDAGDNVKFGFPMAFTVTMLSWSVVEYGNSMGGELGNARAAIRWGSDYILKAFQPPSTLYAQVGNGDADHSCWMRPENMDTPRTVYQVNASSPGTDIAGEFAAALAAASIALRPSDGSYADKLLSTARQLFTFADTYRGLYYDSIGPQARFYQSYSGYNDELLWAATWLHRASGDGTYLDYVVNNQGPLNAAGSATEFSWDSKTAGADILLARQALSCGQTNELYTHIRMAAETFVCYFVNKQVPTTPNGLGYCQDPTLTSAPT